MLIFSKFEPLQVITNDINDVSDGTMVIKTSNSMLVSNISLNINYFMIMSIILIYNNLVY